MGLKFYCMLFPFKLSRCLLFQPQTLKKLWNCCVSTYTFIPVNLFQSGHHFELMSIVVSTPSCRYSAVILAVRSLVRCPLNYIRYLRVFFWRWCNSVCCKTIVALRLENFNSRLLESFFFFFNTLSAHIFNLAACCTLKQICEYYY